MPRLRANLHSTVLSHYWGIHGPGSHFLSCVYVRFHATLSLTQAPSPMNCHCHYEHPRQKAPQVTFCNFSQLPSSAPHPSTSPQPSHRPPISTWSHFLNVTDKQPIECEDCSPHSPLENHSGHCICQQKTSFFLRIADYSVGSSGTSVCFYLGGSRDTKVNQKPRSPPTAFSNTSFMAPSGGN